MQYIRQRDNGTWQVRIYNDNRKFSYTSPNLEEVKEKRNKELGFDPDLREPKILVLDIETSLILVYVFDIWEQTIRPEQIKDDWYILCYGYKWLNDNHTKVVSLADYEGYSGGRSCEEKLINDLHNLLDESDIIIAHNGIAFDIKKINAKFLEYGLSKPKPYRVVDTLRIARRNFKLTSNKLDYILKLLEGKGKLEHDGMPLWLGCMSGDGVCWGKMKAYNKRDVEGLESIYLRLRGWDSSHPNLGVYNSNQVCVSCGSEELILLEDDAYTLSGSYECFRCTVCGQIMRSTKRKNKSSLVGVK